jgi:hypothetical protein
MVTLIAESLYSQVDAKGRNFMIMREIMDHLSYGSAVLVESTYSVDPNCWTSRRMTTRGWKLLVEGRTAQQIGSL